MRLVIGANVTRSTYKKISINISVYIAPNLFVCFKGRRIVSENKSMNRSIRCVKQTFDFPRIPNINYQLCLHEIFYRTKL